MSFSWKSKPIIDLKSDIIHYGFLKLKKSKINSWNLYCILYSNGLLTLFYPPEKKLNKIYYSIPMKEVSSIEKITTSNDPYCFALVPYISTNQVWKFSCNNEHEMNKWISKCTELIKNVNLATHHFINEIDTYSESIYLDLDKTNAEIESQIDCHIQKNNFVNDLVMIENRIVQSQSETQLSKMQSFDNLLSANSLTYSNNSDYYYESANFMGTYNQSLDLLKKKSFNGSYLVRTDSVTFQKYLDVWDDFYMLTFELIFSDDHVKLKDDQMSFENITYLLYYYSFNKLPNSCSHLEIPFRLVD